MTHTATLTEIPANENGRGNLSGYRYSCPCGLELTNTMRTSIEFEISAHERWHAGTDRGLLAPVPGPKGAVR